MDTGDNRSDQTSGGEVTQLIQRWRSGDEAAQDDLFAAIYGDLRRLAATYMREERVGHTLPPTGLVHEAFLRLEREQSAMQLAENKRHFLTLAARAMRRILVEHARRHAAARRPSSREAKTLDELIIDPDFGVDEETSLDEILAVDQAMDRLRDSGERQAQVVELRYFAGLEEAEVAEVLGISRATVTRDWRVARILLRNFLASTEDSKGR